MDVADRPGKLVPGLATEWKVDDTDKKKWRFTLRQGVKFHDGSDFNADAVIWNLDKVLNDKAPQFDKRQSAQVKTRLPSVASYAKIDDATVEITTKAVDFVLPLSDALVPGLQPGAIRKARQGLGQVRQPALRHRPVQADKTGAARTRRAHRRTRTTGTRSGFRRPTR